MSNLVILPCIDSEEMARSCREELDISTTRAADLGQSAVEAAQQGSYSTATGRVVDWHENVRRARREKVSIPPDSPLPASEGPPFPETRIQVSNETTLAAASGWQIMT